MDHTLRNFTVKYHIYIIIPYLAKKFNESVKVFILRKSIKGISSSVSISTFQPNFKSIRLFNWLW